MTRDFTSNYGKVPIRRGRACEARLRPVRKGFFGVNLKEYAS